MAVKYDYRYLRGFIKENFGSNEKFSWPLILQNKYTDPVSLSIR